MIRFSLVLFVWVGACSGPWLWPGVDGSLGASASQPFYYGHPATPYLLHVSNLGDTAGVAPIKVIVQTSLGLAFVEATPTSWVCTPTGPVLLCEYNAALPAGGSLPDLEISWAIGGPEIVKDEIRICSELRVDADINPNNNQLCEVYTPLAPTAKYDLKIEKTLWSATGASAATRSYGIVVTNLGPDQASDPIVVTDVLPPGMTITGYGSSLGVTCSTPTPGSIECVISWLGTASINNSKGITITATVSPSVTGVVPNCAAVSAPQDFELANNQSCATFEVGVPGPFDLQVTGEVYSVPSPGMTGLYRYFIYNAGPNSTSEELVVTLNAPPLQGTLSYVSGINGSPGTATNIGECTPIMGTNQINCPISPLIAVGQTKLIWMSFFMNAGASGNAPACLSIAPLGDTNASNNQACLSLPADPITATYAVTTKMSSTGSPTQGELGRLRVFMENDRAAPTPDPTVVFFTLPAGVSFVGTANTRAFDCLAVDLEQGAELVTCRHDGPLAAGSEAAFDLAVFYETSGDVTLCSDVAPKVAGIIDDPVQRCAMFTVAPAP